MKFLSFFVFVGLISFTASSVFAQGASVIFVTDGGDLDLDLDLYGDGLPSVNEIEQFMVVLEDLNLRDREGVVEDLDHLVWVWVVSSEISRMNRSSFNQLLRKRDIIGGGGRHCESSFRN